MMLKKFISVKKVLLVSIMMVCCALCVIAFKPQSANAGSSSGELKVGNRTYHTDTIPVDVGWEIDESSDIDDCGDCDGISGHYVLIDGGEYPSGCMYVAYTAVDDDYNYYGALRIYADMEKCMQNDFQISSLLIKENSRNIYSDDEPPVYIDGYKRYLFSCGHPLFLQHQNVTNGPTVDFYPIYNGRLVFETTPEESHGTVIPADSSDKLNRVSTGDEFWFEMPLANAVNENAKVEFKDAENLQIVTDAEEYRPPEVALTGTEEDEPLVSEYAIESDEGYVPYLIYEPISEEWGDTKEINVGDTVSLTFPGTLTPAWKIPTPDPDPTPTPTPTPDNPQNGGSDQVSSAGATSPQTGDTNLGFVFAFAAVVSGFCVVYFARRKSQLNK